MAEVVLGLLLHAGVRGSNVDGQRGNQIMRPMHKHEDAGCAVEAGGTVAARAD